MSPCVMHPNTWNIFAVKKKNSNIKKMWQFGKRQIHFCREEDLLAHFLHTHSFLFTSIKSDFFTSHCTLWKVKIFYAHTKDTGLFLHSNHIFFSKTTKNWFINIFNKTNCLATKWFFFILVKSINISLNRTLLYFFLLSQRTTNCPDEI